MTDFLDLGWFPSFNLADVALNVGVVLVLVTGLLHADDEDGDEVPGDLQDTADDDTPQQDGASARG